MSSSRQAIYDDEVDWERFCEKNGIDDTRWKLYSPEYRHAYEQHNKHGYVGRELRLAVSHAIQRDQLAKTQAQEWTELKTLIELEKKYQ
jgi:hypothetical protein